MFCFEVKTLQILQISNSYFRSSVQMILCNQSIYCPERFQTKQNTQLWSRYSASMFSFTLSVGNRDRHLLATFLWWCIEESRVPSPEVNCQQRKCGQTDSSATVILLHQCQNKIINTSSPEQNCQHFADNTFENIFLREDHSILIQVSLKFVPGHPWFQLKISHNGFRQWLSTKQAQNHKLNQWSPSSLIDIWVNRPKWVKYLNFKIIINNCGKWYTNIKAI